MLSLRPKGLRPKGLRPKGLRPKGLRPKGLRPVPEQTARTARAVLPKGSLPMRVRDHLAGVFADEAFGVRGARGYSPGVLALVTVSWFAEDLTDRQVAEAVRDRLAWKYAIGGGELTDAGFEYTVLPRFRARPADNGRERVVLQVPRSGVTCRRCELGVLTVPRSVSP